jgi:PP-loop superfamily ATP-utilizing enzyme
MLGAAPEIDTLVVPIGGGGLISGMAIAAKALRPDIQVIGVQGDLRLRHHGDRARIEVEPAWIPWVTARLDRVRGRLVALGFSQVEIDPRGYRRGALLAERSAAP